MPQPVQVTAAEISRLAGVTRATVSNWRRRHPDFPAPSGGTEASPAYDLAAVRAWLAARGQLPASSPADDLRAALRSSTADPTSRSRLVALTVAASRTADAALAEAAGLADADLTEWARQAVRAHADNLLGADNLPGAGIPDCGAPTHRPDDEAGLIRALLRCVTAAGAERTLDVLAEGDLNEAKATSQYQTPSPVAELAADLLTSPDGGPYPARVFDPACGAGAMLLAAAARGARELAGQELVPLVAAHAAARLALAAQQPASSQQVASAQRVASSQQAGTVGGPASAIAAGDSLRDDAFPTLVADAVLCVPPYGDRDWGHEELAYDPRWVFGLPPRSESELAWLQHCFAHLAPGGRAVLLMPPGAASRPSGRRVRAELLRDGALRAVFALPAGVAQPLHIGLHLWLLERPSPQATPPATVLLLETAAGDPHRAENSAGGRPATEWPALRGALLDAWRDFDRHPDGFEPIPGTARAVPIIDLLDEMVDLTPTRHVRAAFVPARPGELAELAYQLRGRLRKAASELVDLGSGESWPPAGAAPLAWRTASVADLLRGDVLTLLRAPTAGRDPGRGSSREPSREPGREPSRDPGEEIFVRAGDVILSELLRERAGAARVADASDAGQPLDRGRYLLRPDPTRLDPWFLAGFLAAEDNLSAASSGTSVVRVDPRRLRVPLLPLAEQQRYGRAFRQLSAVRTTADRAHRLADETARTLAAGLTGGALLPPTVEKNC